MPARHSSIGIKIDDPPIEALGPRMLACTILQRRFVIGIIENRFKDASRVARVAGYAPNGRNSRQQAYDLLRHPKIIAAIQEESGRRLQGLTAFAVFALERNLKGSDAKARQVAADSILDRTGFPRKMERAVEVTDKTPQRNHDELRALVSAKLQMLGFEAPKLIEGDFNVVQDTSTAPSTDEREGDDAQAGTPDPVEVKGGTKRGR